MWHLYFSSDRTLLSSCARTSLCPRCSPGRDHPLRGGPSGGPVLEVGVCLQRQPFVSPWQSRLAGVSLLYHIADRFMQHILFLFSTWRNPTGPILSYGQRTEENFLTWTGWLWRGGSSPLTHSTRQTMAPTAARPATSLGPAALNMSSSSTVSSGKGRCRGEPLPCENSGILCYHWQRPSESNSKKRLGG